jgi:hypothetical protein
MLSTADVRVSSLVEPMRYTILIFVVPDNSNLLNSIVFIWYNYRELSGKLPEEITGK